MDELKVQMDRIRPKVGNFIFFKVWGSRSHNTHLPESDTDYIGVYLASTKSVLGLHPPSDTIDNTEGEKPDYQLHEAKKFCQLLMKGNPGIVEMLFTDRMCAEEPAWLEVKEERKRFLTRESVKQYLGYAEGQLKRLAAHGGKAGLHTKGGDYNEKWAYHLVRLLYDARRIAKGAEPVVWKEEGSAEHVHLMNIRRNQYSRENIERAAREMIAEIDSLKPWPIPETADEDFLNKWLLALRGIT